VKITFEKFKEIMEHIAAFETLQDKISSASREYNHLTKDMTEFEIPSTTFDTVFVLGLLLEDKDDWICYWVYELDCGRRWEEGTVVSKDGENIPLKTIEDLWAMLNKVDNKTFKNNLEKPIDKTIENVYNK